MDITDLQTSIGEWGNETFKHDSNSIPGLITHLVDEALELANVPKEKRLEVLEMVKGYAPKFPDPAEMADCIILLSQIAHTLGLDLGAETLAKMDVNRKRSWNSRDKDGIIRHND